MLCFCKVWSKLNSPRSLMLKTPLTVLLVLRCLILLSDGEAGVSSTAESTLLRGWVISMAADMVGWLE